MARMKFGPWVRVSEFRDYVADEFVDACTDPVARPAWIDESRIVQARWLPSPQKWVTTSGDRVYPHWVRRRDWALPLDVGVLVGRQGIDMEQNDNGSARLTMHSNGEIIGTIVIPAAELEAVAQWFTKAVEANKQ